MLSLFIAFTLAYQPSGWKCVGCIAVKTCIFDQHIQLTTMLRIILFMPLLYSNHIDMLLI